MRTKEEAEDYRYFPDPDLPPLVIAPSMVEAIRSTLPELPDQKRDRYIREFSLSRYDATSMAGSDSLSGFFEEAVLQGGRDSAKLLANLLTGEVMRLLNESGMSIRESRLTPNQFADLMKLVSDQSVSMTAAKQIIGFLFLEGGEVGPILEREGLTQVNDLSALEPVIDRILEANPKQVEEFRSGKEKVLGFFIGQAMKATQGKANPALLQDLVIRKLKRS
jgi:aspartyl-tRNA(Asn)/glutamyl-tRNA(Gln) amidotransferase subunit B